MRHPRLACTLTLALGLTSADAFADDPAFTYGKKDDVKDVADAVWTGKAEAGVVATTGNSRTTTATASANVTRKSTDNKFDGVVSGTFARASTLVASDDNMNGVIDQGELAHVSATSAENVAGKLRYDRYLTDLNSLYVAALGLIDKPAAKAFQGGGQVGYSRSLYKSDTAEATAEVGYDLSYLAIVDDGSTTIHSARVFTGFKGKVRSDSTAEASVEALFNLNTVTIGGQEASAFEDTRINTTLSLTTALSSKISFSVSYTAKYDRVPAPLAPIGGLKFADGYTPRAETTDTITKASLIVTFL
jgi:putative salt-induced outer membrane protein YdiY